MAEPNSEPNSTPNSDPNQDLGRAKRGRGNPNAANANPSGLPKVVVEVAGEPGGLTSALKAALARAEAAEARLADVEERLADREAKNRVKVLEERVAELEGELAEERAVRAREMAVSDEGSQAALAEIRGIIASRGRR